MKKMTQEGITQDNTTEIYIQKEYKTMRGFIRAVRHYMADIMGEYPEDVLTGHYASNEPMEDVIRREGKYHYDSRTLNIDVNIDTHIYFCSK